MYMEGGGVLAGANLWKGRDEDILTVWESGRRRCPSNLDPDGGHEAFDSLLNYDVGVR